MSEETTEVYCDQELGNNRKAKQMTNYEARNVAGRANHQQVRIHGC